MTNTSNNGALVNITFENLTPHDINLILPDGEVCNRRSRSRWFPC